MRPGMIFTIEPMINIGKAKAVIDKEDGWTARTVDNMLSAQFEHTILVTDSGYEILSDVGEYEIFK
jgi:methionyl aminopeptidase